MAALQMHSIFYATVSGDKAPGKKSKTTVTVLTLHNLINGAKRKVSKK